MGMASPQADEGRDVPAFRALWIALVLLGAAMWAFAAGPDRHHPQQVFDSASYNLAEKLTPLGGSRTSGITLAHTKSRQAAAPSPHIAIAPGASDGVAASGFSTPVLWLAVPVSGADVEAHHYSATGPPGLRLS